MSDELDARIRSLNAERQRPERVVEIPDLLDSLIRALHRLFLTPPDEGSGLALADADDGLLGQPVLDQPGDLGGPDPGLAGPADGVSEPLTGPLSRSVCSAEGPALARQFVADAVAHGHMVAHPGSGQQART